MTLCTRIAWHSLKSLEFYDSIICSWVQCWASFKWGIWILSSLSKVVRHSWCWGDTTILSNFSRAWSNFYETVFHNRKSVYTALKVLNIDIRRHFWKSWSFWISWIIWSIFFLLLLSSSSWFLSGISSCTFIFFTSTFMNIKLKVHLSFDFDCCSSLCAYSSTILTPLRYFWFSARLTSSTYLTQRSAWRAMLTSIVFFIVIIWNFFVLLLSFWLIFIWWILILRLIFRIWTNAAQGVILFFEFWRYHKLTPSKCQLTQSLNTLNQCDWFLSSKPSVIKFCFWKSCNISI